MLGVGDKPVRSVRTAEYDAFLQLLKQLRQEAHLTQKELCERLDQEVTYISKVERGTRRLDVIEFLELAKALGQDPAEILARFRVTQTNRKPNKGQ